MNIKFHECVLRAGYLISPNIYHLGIDFGGCGDILRFWLTLFKISTNHINHVLTPLEVVI